MAGFGDESFGSSALGGEDEVAAGGVVLLLQGSGESDASSDFDRLAAYTPRGDGSSDATADFGRVVGLLLSGAGMADATAALTRIAATAITNRIGGRRRLAEADASWEPTIVPAPAHLVKPAVYDVANAFGTPTIDGARPRYTVDKAKTPRARYRILVGATDVTYFRGIMTPEPAYQLVEPLLYGAATLTFPQVCPPLEQLGVGDLKWLKPGKTVKVQRVLADDADVEQVVGTDYVGVIIGLDISGTQLTVQVGGEASGRAALMDRQLQLFNGTADIGRYAYGLIKDLGLSFTPHLGPRTGITLGKFGGMSMLEYANELCARAWTRNGAQWTIMPDPPNPPGAIDLGTPGGQYRMFRKDLTTIHGTVYLDDQRTVGNLRRDVAEEPNRIFATGVTPEGMRVKFGVYPGLNQGPAAPYPFDDHRSFGAGTTDADTDTGDGVSVMVNRLQVTGYLNQADNFGGYDADVTRAVRALQEDAADGPSFISGNMNLSTWNALFDLDVTGSSLNWAHIEPAAQDPRVRKWRHSGTGGVIGLNPRYRPDRLKVDTSVDMGTGFTRDQMREWAKAELTNSTDDNWVGTIRFATHGLVRGEHNPGDVLTDDDVMPARELRPGMNLWAPLFDGGTMFHVSGASLGSDGFVEAMVDTRARDAMKVWQIIARNREARKNPARLWLQDHRASTTLHDSLTEWDEFGGQITKQHLAGDRWTVLEVIAGQEGTVRKIALETDDPCEYVVALFGKPITPGRLQRLVGNPLTKHGSRRWNREEILNQLDEQNVLLYVAGDYQNPCGYFPKQKTAEGDEGSGGTFAEFAPLTGRWEDEAGVSYHTFAKPVLYLAIYPAKPTTIPAGRILWNQQTVGA